MTKLKSVDVGTKVNIVLLLTAMEEKMTKKGASYCLLTLSDGSEKIKANLWNTTKEEIKTFLNCLINVDLAADDYEGKKSYTVCNLKKADTSYKLTDFILTAPEIGEEIFEEILGILRNAVPKETAESGEMTESTLIDIVEDIYHSHKEKLLKYPGAKALHHSCYGGLLYHMKRVVSEACQTLAVYDSLDKELLLAGAALHDIGKLFELSSNNFGEAEYTKNGILLGHSFIGMQMISQSAKKIGYKGNKLCLLLHLLASHHGEKEWGAMAVPAIPEAMVLHHIDMMDSRIWQFEEAIKSTEKGELSEWIKPLNTPVYHA